MSPVIMAPQVAIGAIGKIQTLPRIASDGAGGGSFQATKVMNVAWAGDHRILDGATMARFSNKWKSYIEEPMKLLAMMR